MGRVGKLVRWTTSGKPCLDFFGKREAISSTTVGSCGLTCSKNSQVESSKRFCALSRNSGLVTNSYVTKWFSWYWRHRCLVSALGYLPISYRLRSLKTQLVARSATLVTGKISGQSLFSRIVTTNGSEKRSWHHNFKNYNCWNICGLLDPIHLENIEQEIFPVT